MNNAFQIDSIKPKEKFNVLVSDDGYLLKIYMLLIMSMCYFLRAVIQISHGYAIATFESCQATIGKND